MSIGCFLPYIGLGSCLLHMPYIHEFAKKEGPITILTFSKSLVDALKSRFTPSSSPSGPGSPKARGQRRLSAA